MKENKNFKMLVIFAISTLFLLAILTVFPNFIAIRTINIQDNYETGFDEAGVYMTYQCNSIDNATAITSDSSGNIYVTGYSYNGMSADYATVAYDSLGNKLWESSYNGPENGDDKPCAIAVDTTGVYVTGSSYGGRRSNIRL